MHVAASVQASMHIRKWWKRAAVSILFQMKVARVSKVMQSFVNKIGSPGVQIGMPSFVVEASFVQSMLKLHLERDTS